MLAGVRRASSSQMHECMHQAVGWTVHQGTTPPLPVITQCLLAQQYRTWRHRASRSRDSFSTGAFNFHQLSWVTHEHLKGKLFLSLSSVTEKQVLTGTGTRCSMLANTNISTRTALDTCWAAVCCLFSCNYSLYLRIQQSNNCHHGSVMLNLIIFMCKKFIYIHIDRHLIRQYRHEYKPVYTDRLQKTLST